MVGVEEGKGEKVMGGGDVHTGLVHVCTGDLRPSSHVIPQIPATLFFEAESLPEIWGSPIR